MDRFYQTMHSVGNVTYTEFDNVLCRLSHNVNVFINYLFIKSNYSIFLLDNISTSFPKNSPHFTS
jgi:hypothetical protein